MGFLDYLITAISYLRQPQKRRLIKTAYQLKSKRGIEIGGPSAIFGLKGLLPVYLFAKDIDGVNFSSETVWEGSIKEGNTYNYYHSKTGFQFIAEATSLKDVESSKYDFLLSSHSLEHVANPIKALKEWNRVLKKDGILVLVLPDKRYTFDINRPYTTLQHMLDDYNSNKDEYDETHFDEIVNCHVPTMDPLMKKESELLAVLKDNFKNRTAHHHVFDQEITRQLLNYCGFTVKYQQDAYPFHLITLATRQ